MIRKHSPVAPGNPRNLRDLRRRRSLLELRAVRRAHDLRLLIGGCANEPANSRSLAPSASTQPVLRAIPSPRRVRPAAWNRMENQMQTPKQEDSAPNETAPKRSTIASFLLSSVARPPWVGLILLCLGSMIFELTLFALLPMTEEARSLLSMRLLLTAIAAIPALAAVVVAVAANRKSPLVPKIDYPAARISNVGAAAPQPKRWQDYHD